MKHSDEEYIAINTQSYPAGTGEIFSWDYTRGVFHLIPESLLQVLRLTNRFRSLKAHRNVLIEAGWQDDGSGTIDGMLNELVHRGLLRSKKPFLKALTDVSAPAKDKAHISSLGWLTRDRPKLLKRSVESFIDNCVEHNRHVKYKVFDDSSDESTRVKTRALLSELAASRRAAILYAGEEEKREFADQILRKAASEKLPEEVVEFALFDPYGMGFTPGANSNCFLLGTTGELCLMIDHDCIGKFCRSPASRDEVALDSSLDPTHFQFFSDRTDLLNNVDFQDLSILECHERLLGRPLPECLRSEMECGNLDVTRLTPEFLRFLETDSAKVTVTMTGVVGDSGMGSSRMLLGLTDENREVLFATEESYKTALVSREILRMVNVATVGHGGLLMAMNCGFDNRTILPPFFPVLRGSDGLFSQTLRTCQSESMIAYLPIACFHDPPEPRVHHPEEVVSSSIRMVDILMLLVRSFGDFEKLKPGQISYKDLGQYLLQIGESDTSNFVEILRTLWVTEMSRYIEYLEYLLALNNYRPRYWAEHVAVHIDSIRENATSTDLVVDDLSRDGHERKVDILCQELVGAFGKLLYWWPLIWEVSRSSKLEMHRC